jgi:hypothetical protein
MAISYAFTDDPPTAESLSEYRRRAAGVAFVALLALSVVVLAGVGGPHDAFTGALIVVDRVLFALWPALAWVLGAVGLGLWLGAKLLPESSAALRGSLGVAAMLWVSHLSGVMGLPGGTMGAALAWLPVVVGMVLGAARALARLRGGGVEVRVPWTALPAAVALAVLVVAASNPPGWLWDSEFRAYDTLSYHLLLPQQWIERGGVWPSEDNVYGSLPGYLEAAWAQLGAMTMAPREHGLIAGAGYRLLSCQMLHAMLVLLGGWVTAEAARHAATRAGLPEDRARYAGRHGGADRAMHALGDCHRLARLQRHGNGLTGRGGAARGGGTRRAHTAPARPRRRVARWSRLLGEADGGALLHAGRRRTPAGHLSACGVGLADVRRRRRWPGHDRPVARPERDRNGQPRLSVRCGALPERGRRHGLVERRTGRQVRWRATTSRAAWSTG